MWIIHITRKDRSEGDDVFEVETEHGVYEITGEIIKDLLVRNGDMCEYCEGKGCDNCKDYDSQREGK